MQPFGREAVCRTGHFQPLQKADPLQGSQGAPHPGFGEIQLAVTSEGDPIDWECAAKPARGGVEAGEE